MIPNIPYCIQKCHFISQLEKDKYCLTSLICGILKIKLMDEYNKTEIDSQM